MGQILVSVAVLHRFYLSIFLFSCFLLPCLANEVTETRHLHNRFCLSVECGTLHLHFGYTVKIHPACSKILNSLTHSLTELSSSLEADNCAATQDIPSICGTMRFITVFTRALHWFLSWAGSYPTHTKPSYLSQIHFSIVHTTTSWSSYCSEILKASENFR
jgi:hypothetical protein